MGKYLGAVPNPVLKHNDIYLESPFGERKYQGKIEKHNGIDLQYRPNNKKNTPDTIIALADGIVTKTSYSASRGYYVEIRHNAEYISRYLHMVKGSIKVKVGQAVKKGDELGITGMTGAADGIHLHLAIELRGEYVDPLPYILGELDVSKPYFEIGKTYKFIKEKYVRKTPRVAVNKYPWSKLKPNAKLKCHKDKDGYAIYNIGAKVTFKEFRTDIHGNLWGRTNTLWACVLDKTGLQVEKQ